MKKNLLFLALALVALSASAQQNQTPAEQPAAIVAQPALRFGYFSFELTGEGDAFELDTVQFMAVPTQRRI
jgi:phosphate-selective porin